MQTASGQYYITGLVKNTYNTPLSSVKMRLQSSKLLYQSGSQGEFGIPSKLSNDTVICWAEGYDTLRAALNSRLYNAITLTPTPQLDKRIKNGSRLSSITKDLVKDPQFIRNINGESYSNAVENDFVQASRYPVTSFSLNVDKASYSNIRRFINNKTDPPSDAIRIEEMLNYFSLSCAAPPAGTALFNIDSRISNCPWNGKNLLLFINAQARKMDLDKVPASNLVFLIDDSGSMDMINRLPLLKAAFKMLTANLRDRDTVTIITYGGTAGIVLGPTSGADKLKINNAIETITPGGATAGSGGIKMAYQMAEHSFIKNGNNRVILATDGDFNVGQVTEKELEDLILHYKNSGIYLTCLGVGMGNYKDSKLETLARHGNGNFAYLDTEAEAEKVLVTEFTQTLFAIANNVSLSVDFNPKVIKSYRLIGFDNKQEALTDSTSMLAGGEIGSGHSMMALIELEPVDTSRIGILHSTDKVAGSILLKYNLPNTGEAEQLSEEVTLNYQHFSELDRNLQFATAVSMFGSLLKQSRFTPAVTFDQVLQIATPAASPGNLLQQEFLKLVSDAKLMMTEQKSKRKRKKEQE